MKLTNTLNKKSKSGMTLLELTVVILVLLSLISILFIGARAWKKGSDRAGCILNIRNVQQAASGYKNMHPALTSATIGAASANIIGATGLLKDPVCPGAGLYTIDLTKIYATGTAGGASVAASCSLAPTEEHVPEGDLSQW